MVVIPVAVLRLVRVAESLRRVIVAGVDIHIVIVFEQPGSEEITSKPVAFRGCMSIVEVDGNLRYSGAGVVGIEIIGKAHNHWLAVIFQNCGSLDLSIKTPDIAGRQVGME